MRILSISILFIMISCSYTYSQETEEVEVIPFSKLEEIISKPSNKIKVINFWATWCKPCIAEMPSFEEVSIHHEKEVELYFVSLDFPEEKDKVNRFQQKKKLKSKIVLLSDTNYDVFMPKVSKKWTGAIPATLFVDKEGNRYFYEKPFSKKELLSVVVDFIN